MVGKELEKHRDYVLAVASRILNDSHAAEDVTQRVMLCAWRQNYKDKGVPRSWLRKITRGICVDYMREVESQNLVESRAEFKTAKDANAWLEPVEEIILHHELAEAIKRGVSLLPPMQRKVFEMRRVGYRHQDIADELGIERKTTENYLRLAYEAMRDYLAAWGFSPNTPLPGKNSLGGLVAP